jgi:tight adherence protein B
MVFTLMAVMFAAVSVALLVWAASSLLGDAVSGEKKKLQARLSSEIRMDEPDTAFARSIRRDIDVKGISRILIRFPPALGVHLALEQTWPNMTVARFLAIAGGIAAGVFIIGLAFVGSVLVAGGAALAAGFIPFGLLSNRRARRQNLLSEQLPEALDFLGRILRAGHSLSTGLQMIGEELPQPLAEEFRRAYSAHSLGRSLDDALKEAANRVTSTDFGFFVTAVLIQRQTGGDLSEVLDNISDMIRGRLRLQQQVRAKTAEGRFTGYILAAFPAIMFFLSYALNPTYASVLLHGTGVYLLATSAGLCTVGLILIRKITTVRV